MRVVVTGAAGFIGSNIVQGLNARGIDDIIAVDDLTQGDKFRNLSDLRIADYVDAATFYTRFAQGDYGTGTFQIAVSCTLNTNGTTNNVWSGTLTVFRRASCNSLALLAGM